jgi:pimeloyl-ACP methyl ester carboxylesterase
VVAPDLLGHGMAPRSNSYKIEDFVSNILPRVAGRDIDLLIGHSLGGPVSLGLYPHLSTKPKRFVLVDPVWFCLARAFVDIPGNR